MKSKGRKQIIGTAKKPRLCVFRSHEHIYVQAIDDTTSSTIVACSTLEPYVREILETFRIQTYKMTKSENEKNGNRTYNSRTREAAKIVGVIVGKRLINKDITHVVFDKRNKLYHGRIKSLADGAREAGLVF